MLCARPIGNGRTFSITNADMDNKTESQNLQQYEKNKDESAPVYKPDLKYVGS